MGEGDYEWLTLAARLWVKQQATTDHTTGINAPVTAVEAVAGRLLRVVGRAANEGAWLTVAVGAFGFLSGMPIDSATYMAAASLVHIALC